MRNMLKYFQVALVGILWADPAIAGSAEEAWTSLVGERLGGRPGFEFIENNPVLPNVLIYGDSISIAYTACVRANLDGKANLYRLYCNGGDSGSFIRKMTEMHNVMGNANLDKPWTFQWDVIHFNVGLHDLKYFENGKLDINGKQVSSISEYKKNLHAIIAYLKKLSPEAQLIFATTTPVPEGGAGRIAGDAERYNAAAMDVLGQYPEIMINDLFAFTRPNHSKWWTAPGNVHYNEAGCNAQGVEVARLIIKALEMEGRSTGTKGGSIK